MCNRMGGGACVVRCKKDSERDKKDKIDGEDQGCPLDSGFDVSTHFQ